MLLNKTSNNTKSKLWDLFTKELGMTTDDITVFLAIIYGKFQCSYPHGSYKSQYDHRNHIKVNEILNQKKEETTEVLFTYNQISASTQGLLAFYGKIYEKLYDKEGTPKEEVNSKKMLIDVSESMYYLMTGANITIDSDANNIKIEEFYNISEEYYHTHYKKLDKIINDSNKSIEERCFDIINTITNPGKEKKLINSLDDFNQIIEQIKNKYNELTKEGGYFKNSNFFDNNSLPVIVVLDLIAEKLIKLHSLENSKISQYIIPTIYVDLMNEPLIQQYIKYINKNKFSDSVTTALSHLSFSSDNRPSFFSLYIYCTKVSQLIKHNNDIVNLKLTLFSDSVSAYNINYEFSTFALLYFQESKIASRDVLDKLHNIYDQTNKKLLPYVQKYYDPDKKLKDFELKILESTYDNIIMDQKETYVNSYIHIVQNSKTKKLRKSSLIYTIGELCLTSLLALYCTFSILENNSINLGMPKNLICTNNYIAGSLLMLSTIFFVALITFNSCKRHENTELNYTPNSDLNTTNTSFIQNNVMSSPDYNKNLFHKVNYSVQKNIYK